MFSLIFIRRPILASVLSILIVLMGLVVYPTLPVSQNPDITPPVIQVRAVYPGASAQVIADAVAAPIEQEVNGVEGMLYMQSTSAADGSYTLQITFDVGTNVDIASVLVQNRVSIAQPKLPEEVRRQGVTTKKVSTSLVIVSALAPDAEKLKTMSPERVAALKAQYDDLFLSNYLLINIQDEIRRIKGVGDTTIVPAKDYAMRVWLDPDKLKARELTTVDVIRALQEQNAQVAAGVIGQPPVPAGLSFQLNVTTLGRLKTVEQFENVIVRADANRIIRVKDVARVELGGRSYDSVGRFSGGPAGIFIVFLAPGGNAVEVAESVTKLLDSKASQLPEGLSFKPVYDTAEFVNEAVAEVFKTFYEALILVLAVVLVFLGSPRTTLIPILAIQVSIIGTFFFAKILGFSINLPVLFGLVLAIGVVVDDAIVVVENVERVMAEKHLAPKEATAEAMKEVFGAIIAISLVLMAVFLPTAALPGISGSIFRQFALTIAASTFLSVICALTLAPALCGVLLRSHHGPNASKTFILERPFLAFGRVFNRVFDRIANGYAWIIRQAVRPSLIIIPLALFGLAMYGVLWTTSRVPTGFVPTEDKGFVVVELWLPDGASQERTIEVVAKAEKLLPKVDGVTWFVALPGTSLINGNGPNYATIYIRLEPWSVRTPKGRTMPVVLGEVQGLLWTQINDAIAIAFTLPAIDGLGSADGWDLRIQDRGSLGRAALASVTDGFVADANAQSKLAGTRSAYREGVPIIFADVDREKVKKFNIPLGDVFSTLSGFLGSAYVNDFNLFDRTWQVTVQADSRFRATIDDIGRLQVRSSDGRMIPMAALVKAELSSAPDRVIRYNLFTAAVVNGSPARGVSTGDAMAVVDDMVRQSFPTGVTAEWTGMSFQERKIAGQGNLIFGLAILVVYLILAALYESWTTPLAVILSIPLAALGAMLGLMYRGMDNNIYTQVGLVLLVGLGAKNAILIVEFARDYRMKGKSITESAVEAARLRLRPILMTALAFILGVYPLVNATGAGGASRQAIGTSVFFGMIGNTVLGLFFTPVLFVAITWFSELFTGKPKPHTPAPAPSGTDSSHDTPPAAPAQHA